jgi:hypothetical protein
MAINISNVYIQTFENIVRHLAQQRQARLRMCVDERGVSSEKHNWERMGSNTAAEKTSARIATPENDSDWTRRVSVAKTFHVGDTIEQEDPVQMLVDPQSNIAHSLAMAMKRAQDDSIIAAATGNALDGAGAPVVFPVAQVVGDGLGVFSFDGVTEVYEKFMTNDIDPEETKYMVIGPVQLRKMQQLTEYTSSDYVNIKTLATNGFVRSWMGFDWIVSTRLLAPVGGQISCFAMTKRALGLQMNRDIAVRVAEDPSISFAWRVYCYGTWGATRVEDEQIVHWHLKDSLT